MILNRDTKHAVAVGDVLKCDCMEFYAVLTVIPGARGSVCFTVRDRCGRTIYAMPSYMFYGAEIVKEQDC